MTENKFKYDLKKLQHKNQIKMGQSLWSLTWKHKKKTF